MQRDMLHPGLCLCCCSLQSYSSCSPTAEAASSPRAVAISSLLLHRRTLLCLHLSTRQMYSNSPCAHGAAAGPSFISLPDFYTVPNWFPPLSPAAQPVFIISLLSFFCVSQGYLPEELFHCPSSKTLSSSWLSIM